MDVFGGVLFIVLGIILLALAPFSHQLERLQTRLWNRSYSEREEKYYRIFCLAGGVLSILFGLFAFKGYRWA